MSCVASTGYYLGIRHAQFTRTRTLSCLLGGSIHSQFSLTEDEERVSHEVPKTLHAGCLHVADASRRGDSGAHEAANCSGVNNRNCFVTN